MVTEEGEGGMHKTLDQYLISVKVNPSMGKSLPSLKTLTQKIPNFNIKFLSS